MESLMDKNPYHILEVSRNANLMEITEAYRRLAKKYHPDVNQSPAASARMREINWAYDVLCDPVERASIDRKHRTYRAQWEKRYRPSTPSRPRARAHSRAQQWSGESSRKPQSTARRLSFILHETFHSILDQVLLSVMVGLVLWVISILLINAFVNIGLLISFVIACYIASDTSAKESSQNCKIIGALFGLFCAIGIQIDMHRLLGPGFTPILMFSIPLLCLVGASIGPVVGTLASKIWRSFTTH
jgi:hypothetical protein